MNRFKTDIIVTEKGLDPKGNKLSIPERLNPVPLKCIIEEKEEEINPNPKDEYKECEKCLTKHGRYHIFNVDGVFMCFSCLVAFRRNNLRNNK